MIKKILIAQPTSVGSSPQYVNLSNKYSVNLTFTQFFKIEPVSARYFRGQGISIPDFSAIVFTSRATIDAFFAICKEIKVKMPDEQKYFCTTEAVALYLQKHIVYRKRKIFFGDGSFRSIIKLAMLDKHKEEKFLIVTPEQPNPEIVTSFQEAGLSFKTAVMAHFVGVNLKHLELSDYQAICFYNSADVKSLKENFPTYKQGKTKIIAFGNGTRKALKEAGFKITIEGPTKELPSLTSALETLLKDPDFVQTVLPADASSAKTAPVAKKKAAEKKTEKKAEKNTEPVTEGKAVQKKATAKKSPAKSSTSKTATVKKTKKQTPSVTNTKEKKASATKTQKKKTSATKPTAKKSSTTKTQEKKPSATKPTAKKASASKPVKKVSKKKEAK